jgi:ssDNA-binding Zn-finger/Zn-ribbon topoisomerase 1
MSEPIVCPECNAFMRLMHGRFGYFFGCSGYPACDATHPADKEGKPIGAVANSTTRKMRAFVLHEIRRLSGFGRKIPDGMKRRYERVIYHWLAANMPWERRGVECFVSHFSEAECARAMQLFRCYGLREILSWGRANGFWAKADNTATPAAWKRPGASLHIHPREAR